MHKIISLTLIFISSVSLAKNSMSFHEIAERIKNDRSSLEREKAIDDLKKAGIASGSAIAIWGVFHLVMNTCKLANAPFMDSKFFSMPLAFWTFIGWGLTEVGLVGYAGVKGGQGAKHLFMPDHKLDVSNKETIHE